ncbi:hypothetical protein EYC80_001573 [Monilinia laxa]|uniref:Major facilitator superfamily (MFS) profile domain-containing protein n=1 Tax=Monilinia laxa TaxID=61186 RepID=A0A5N6K5I9_MONLA|nr:hypothetical protein EYC80_001573 [Monilinia laxa]
MERMEKGKISTTLEKQSSSSKAEVESSQPKDHESLPQKQAHMEIIGSTDPPRNIHGLSWVSVVFSIISSIYAIDNTITADVIPVAQQSGIGIGLSVAGELFLNFALKSLREVFSGTTGQDLESAILGISGNFFETLRSHTREQALTAIAN